MPGSPISATFPNSRAIDRATYDPAARTLDIWYVGGDLYCYFDVPQGVFEQLRTAASAGEYVNHWIKPRFRYEIEPRRRRFRPRDDD